MVSTSCKDANDTKWNWGYQVFPGEDKAQSSGLVLNNKDILVPNKTWNPQLPGYT